MSHRLFDLKGRVALVTGGSKGLGKAMARGFAEAGADVVISSRHADELEATAAEIRSATTSRPSRRTQTLHSSHRGDRHVPRRRLGSQGLGWLKLKGRPHPQQLGGGSGQTAALRVRVLTLMVGSRCHRCIDDTILYVSGRESANRRPR